jgi:nicotinamidase-related amidase
MKNYSTYNQLPIPSHFDSGMTARVWKVAYQEITKQAQEWVQMHQIKPASEDKVKIALVAVDVQNSFCLPEFELFVGGHSGTGAIEDTTRLCEFIYRNLSVITQIIATLDTHTAMQIFHPIFLIDEDGRNPPPMTLISSEDLQSDKWSFNPEIASSLGIDPDYGQKHVLHYAKQLKHRGKYDLTIWPYHVMQGSIGNALVASFEEALFFHTVARLSQVDFIVKGDHPLTESYSAIGPEVLQDVQGVTIAQKQKKLLQKVIEFDVIIIAGQAKSHCVAWTVDDLLDMILDHDESLTGKIYLLKDCASPVVVPGVVDFSEQADAAYQRFADSGIHIVKSTDPISQWPDIPEYADK